MKEAELQFALTDRIMQAPPARATTNYRKKFLHSYLNTMAAAVDEWETTFEIWSFSSSHHNIPIIT